MISGSVAPGDSWRWSKPAFDADVVVDHDLGAAEVKLVARPGGQGHDFAVLLLHGVVDEAGQEEAAEIFAVAAQA